MAYPWGLRPNHRNHIFLHKLQCCNQVRFQWISSCTINVSNSGSWRTEAKFWSFASQEKVTAYSTRGYKILPTLSQNFMHVKLTLFSDKSRKTSCDSNKAAVCNGPIYFTLLLCSKWHIHKVILHQKKVKNWILHSSCMFRAWCNLQNTLTNYIGYAICGTTSPPQVFFLSVSLLLAGQSG